MSEDRIPYLRSDMDEEEQKLWDNTLMDGLEHLDKEETIQNIKNCLQTFSKIIAPYELIIKSSHKYEKKQ